MPLRGNNFNTLKNLSIKYWVLDIKASKYIQNKTVSWINVQHLA